MQGSVQFLKALGVDAAFGQQFSQSHFAENSYHVLKAHLRRKRSDLITHFCDGGCQHPSSLGIAENARDAAVQTQPCHGVVIHMRAQHRLGHALRAKIPKQIPQESDAVVHPVARPPGEDRLQSLYRRGAGREAMWPIGVDMALKTRLKTV